MHALVKAAPGAGPAALADWPRPAAQAGWVLIDVAACGICGTDLHILAGTHRSYPPVVLGHEYAGTVVELGDGVQNLHVGDRVVVEQHAGACGTCNVCRSGMIHLCEHKRPPGWGIDGAFARYVAAPADLAHIVPDDLLLTTAALSEPLAIVLTGLARLHITVGDTIGVIGPGSLGLLTAIAAQASGAARVVVAGRTSSAARLALAGRLGFEVINTDNVQPGSAAPHGLDSVVDTTGSPSGIAYGLNLLKRAGQMVSLGLSDSDVVPVPWQLAMQRAITIHFSLSSEYASWDHALSLLRAVHRDVEQMTTFFPLREWQDAMRAVQQRSVIKALLIPE
jgi:L-iditol 2-dehydrogenase